MPKRQLHHCRRPPKYKTWSTLLIVCHNFRTIGNVVVNPFCILNFQTHTSGRRRNAHGRIHDSIAVDVIRRRMEQIVAVELRVVIAGVTMAKRVAFAIHLILADDRRRSSPSRRTYIAPVQIPITLRAIVNARDATGRVD